MCSSQCSSCCASSFSSFWTGGKYSLLVKHQLDTYKIYSEFFIDSLYFIKDLVSHTPRDQKATSKEKTPSGIKSSALGITTRRQIVGESHLLLLDSGLNLEHKICQPANVNFPQIVAGLSYMAHFISPTAGIFEFQ